MGYGVGGTSFQDFYYYRNLSSSDTVVATQSYGVETDNGVSSIYYPTIESIASASYTGAGSQWNEHTGLEFVEWNTARDGSGISFTAGETNDIPASELSSALTVYAIWDNGEVEPDYQMIDAALLNVALTETASVIRSKTGTSTSLTWDMSKGFATTIGEIPEGIEIGVAESYKYSLPTSAFNNNNTITKAHFPSCTTIGNSAFYFCPSLSEVFFPACTSIGNYAFWSCYSLKKTSFPACTSIGSSAFMYCVSLSEASFPACTKIDSNGFYSCPRLKEVSFPACKIIGSNAFYSCSSITEAYFPVCTTISYFAFQYVTGNLYLGAYTNSNIYTIFGKTTSAAASNSSYASYIQISGIEIPAMTSIASYAFYSASKLQTVKAANCTTISGYAFNNCSRLTKVSFPACKVIGSSAFFSCKSLMSAYFLNSSVCTLGTGVFTQTPMSNSAYTGTFGSIYVPSSLVNSYKTATNWTAYSNRITAYVES